jgi:Zn-dependent peptidase ImmA (M78 family)/transcriptional regulator with XRE-family HTH domain
MTFNPRRLGTARKRRLLNKRGFAKALGVTEHTVMRWEKSETEPEPEMLEAIAKLLCFPKEFFFGEDLDMPETASFRSYTTMSAAIREASLSAGALGFMLSDWVEEQFNLPKIQTPDLHLYKPEEAARVLRAEWGLGEKPISNMLHLLESKGVRVLSLAENTVKVNAYSIWRDGKPYVFLNNYKSAESSRFDAAHELGHLVLHQDGGSTGREAEDQANHFASSFLMPRADVVAMLPRVSYLDQIIRAKSRWRVSAAALAYRLRQLSIVSEWKYRDLVIEMSSKGYNRNEPAPIERERSVVWQKVLTQLWADKTTQMHIAKKLNLPEEEINGLIFGVVASTEPPPKGSALSIVDVANQ